LTLSAKPNPNPAEAAIAPVIRSARRSDLLLDEFSFGVQDNFAARSFRRLNFIAFVFLKLARVWSFVTKN
jgi:hypothetical protein